jgi:glutamyl-tRNA reductase
MPWFKLVKNQNDTEISSELSLFAAVQYIMKNVEDVGNKTFFVWNSKIGRNTCENLVKHTKTNTHINQ